MEWASFLAIVLAMHGSILQKELTNLKTKVTFTIKNAGFNVEGTFTEIKTVILWKEEAPESSQISSVVKVKSIDTGIHLRDKHLLSEEYFYANKFPEIVMQSRRLQRKDATHWEGVFELTMRGTTRQMVIPFSYKQINGNGIWSAYFTLNRLDFQIGEKSWLMGNEVKVHVAIYAEN